MENEIAVNDYIFEGAHIWPAVRISLLYLLHNIDARTTPALTADIGWQRLIGRIEDRFNALYPDPSPDYSGGHITGIEALATQAGFAGQASHDALFFVRAEEHFLDSSQGHYAPILDPWFEMASRRYRAAKIELLSDLSIRRLTRQHLTLMLPQTFQTFTTQDGAQAALLAGRSRDLCAEILRWAEGVGLPFGDSLSAIPTTVVNAWQFKRYFDRLLASLSAKTIFLNCFYSLPALGLAWSAREHGIRTVEVQHGVNGAWHHGYTHWSALPAGGYHMLPEIFLTWGRSSAANLSRWFGQRHDFHKVIVGGKPTPMPAGRSDSEDIQSLEHLRDGYRRTILVTLQTSSTTGFSEQLQGLIAASPRDWLWLIRAHPMPAEDSRSRPEEVAGIAASLGLSNVESIRATRAPLDRLLRLSDHHVTACSSTVLEAIAHDVPTTFISPIALTLHGWLLDRRGAYYAPESAEFTRSVEQGKAGLDWQQNQQEIINDPELADRLLAALCG